MIISSWNILDWVLLGLFTVLVLIGITRGLIGSVVAIVTVYLAVFLARFFSDDAAAWISDNFGWFESGSTLGIFVSAVIIFLLVILAGWLFIKLLRPILNVSIIAWVDRLGGLLFGVAAGALAVFFVVAYLYGSVDSDSSRDDYLQENINRFLGDEIESQFNEAELLPLAVDQVDIVPNDVLRQVPGEYLGSFQELQQDYEKP